MSKSKTAPCGVSEVYEDPRNVARPYTYTVRIGSIVRHERHHRRDEADRHRDELADQLAELAERLAAQ